MNRQTPIGCRAYHHYKTVGKDKVCMYCGYGFITRVYGDSKITLVRNPLFDE